jgi:homoserine kinase
MSTTSANGVAISGVPAQAAASRESLRLRLPATSANLGPGFDTVALALTLALEIDATRAPDFAINAKGRNTEVCSSLRRNLMLDVYQKTLAANDADLIPLALEIHNEIPIGMGFGSSAVVRLAGLALANHFGGLGWSRGRILDEASRLEGHPDNVAACWLGGFTVAAMDAGHVHAVSLAPPVGWRVLLAVPEKPLATTAARQVLPRSYDQDDVVFNIQRASLMAAAFATGRGDLLRVAMQDRMHQPFRGAICPLLPSLLPLAGTNGILGVSLSGAGPSVLLLLDGSSRIEEIRALATSYLSEPAELIDCGIETSPAVVETALAAK